VQLLSSTSRYLKRLLMSLNSIQSVVSVRYVHHDVRSRCRSNVIGFSITSEELYDAVMSYIRENSVTGWPNLGSVISGVKASPALRWANPLEVKNAVEKAFTETFGAKEVAKSKAKVYYILCNPCLLLLIPWCRTLRKRRLRSQRQLHQRSMLALVHPIENPYLKRDSWVLCTSRERTLRPDPNFVSSTCARPMAKSGHVSHRNQTAICTLVIPRLSS
jgi:hypothetical protein